MLATSLITLSIAGSSLASYAPAYVACPATPLLRMTGTQANQTLHPDEVAYVAGKKALVPAALASYLGKLASTVYGGSLDASGATTPTISIAISGGGDRAALFGAAAISSFDARNDSSVAKGFGGLFQSATYDPMVLGDGNSTGWSLQNDLFAPVNASYTPKFVSQIMSDLSLKRYAGATFNVTFNDYWSRTLSHHYLPGTTYTNFFDNITSDHGASITFSSATTLSSYTSHAIPFPIIVGLAYSVNDHDAPLKGAAVPLSNVLYEMTPIEFGSYDPQLAAFVPMASLGTAMNAGVPYGGSSVGNCVTNFDNAGFILGTSSNLFNLYNGTNNAAWTNNASAINVAWKLINSTYYSIQPDQQLDITAIPNPFLNVQPGVFEDFDQVQLRIIDGGIAGEVDPIAPLEVPARKIDLLVVVDGSADSPQNYPLGNSMVATEIRTTILPNYATNMPPLPLSVATYNAQQLNQRPSFFGCKGTAATLNGTKVASPYPILVYIPNYDPSGVTNTSTSQLVYSNAAASRFLDTASAIITRGIPQADGSADPLWATCLACTTVERVRGRNGVDMTPACSACFARYCWSGIEAAAVPASTSSASGVKPTSTASGVVPPAATATSSAGKLTTTAFAGVLAFVVSYLI